MPESGVAQRFRHAAVFYRDLTELVGLVLPFVRGGLELGEPVLVAQPTDRLDAVRRALGEDAADVVFLDMTELGRNPARIIPAWRDFLAEYGRDRAVRGVAEPAWRGRRRAELEECRLHESLLNLAFGDGPSWQLVCPYDAGALPTDVIDDARRTHPYVGPLPGRTSSAYRGARHALAEFAKPLPAAHRDAVEVRFGHEDLAALRDVVRRLGQTARLRPDTVEDLVLASHELATNSVRHGGGGGVLRAWQTPESLVVELADAGVIANPLAGREPADCFDESGRGLWMANQLCDLVQVRSSAAGTTVRLHAWL